MMKHILLLSMSFFTYCVSSCWKTCGGDYTVYNTRYRIVFFFTACSVSLFRVVRVKNPGPVPGLPKCSCPKRRTIFSCGAHGEEKEG